MPFVSPPDAPTAGGGSGGPRARHVVIVPYSRFGQGDGAYCVGIANGLQRRGIAVTFLAGGQTAQIAERHGHRVVHDDLLATDLFLTRHASPIGSLSLESFLLLRPKDHEIPSAVESHATAALDVLRERFRDLKPDLVLGAFHWPALLAAASLGIPRVSLIHTPNHPAAGCPAGWFPDLVAPADFRSHTPQRTLVNRLAARYDLPPIEAMNECHDAELILTFGPSAELAGAPRTIVIGEPTGEVGERHAPSRRVGGGEVYCYLGPPEYGWRDEHGLRDVVRSVLAAAPRFPQHTFVVVDAAAPRWAARLELPRNVRVLEHCWDAAPHIREGAAAIHHGGGYTALTAFWWGVPSVVVPYNVDNHYRARAGAAWRLAVDFPRGARPPESIELVSGDGQAWQLFGHRRYDRHDDELVAALDAALASGRDGLAEAAERFREGHATLDEGAAAVADLLAGRAPRSGGP